MKVFLGGTCNGSKWRDELIPKLTIDYFDPVVEDWTPECQQEEIRQRDLCDIVLYVITPKMKGAYAVAEAVDDSNKRPDRTAFCFVTVETGTGMFSHDYVSFDDHQIKALNYVGEMIKNNGGLWIKDFNKLHEVLNDFENKRNYEI